MRISTKGKWPLVTKFGLQFLFVLAVLIPSWAVASSSADETNPGTNIAATSGTAVADGVATDTITVTLVDSGGIAQAGVNVDVAVSGGNATLLPSGTQQTDVNGQVILTVSNTVAETVNVTADFDKNGGAGTDQAVLNGSPATVEFTAGPPSAANSLISTTDDNAVADGADTNTVEVLVRDANNNPVPSSPVDVILTGTGSAVVGSIPANTDGSGVISIDLTDTTAEALTVGFEVDSTAGSNTTSVTFVAGAASAANSVISTTADNAVADGVNTNTVEVLVRDANNNPVVSTTVAVTLTGTAGASVGSIPPDTDASGLISVDLTDTTAEALAVGFTVDAVAGSNTTPVTFVAGAAVKLVFGEQPGNTVAGAVIAPAIKVEIQDALGNLVTTATDNVNLAFDNNPGGLGTLLGTLSRAAVDGVATFDDISVDEIGSGYTLRATAGGLTNGISNAFDVTPRAVLTVVISNGVDSVTVGTTSTYFVSVRNDGPGDLTIANGGGVFIGINGDEGIDNLHLGNTRAPINDVEGWVELVSGQSVFFPVTGDVIAASQAMVSVTASSPSGVATVTASDVDAISYPLTYTLNDVNYSLQCGATFIHQDAGGVVTVSESGCWDDIYPAVPGAETLVFTRTHEIADRSCPLDVMTMDAMGNITITAQGSCIDLDIDNDSIPNEFDPEPNDPTAPIETVYCTPYIDGNVYLAGFGAVYIDDCTSVDGSIFVGTGGVQIGDGIDGPDNVLFRAKDAVRILGGFNVLDDVEYSVETNYSPAP